MSGPDRLSARQRQAVLAVATSPTLDVAAAVIGVSPRTLRRWRAREDFTAAVRAAAHDLHREAVDHVRASQVDAVATLRAALSDESGNVRVRAASVLLDAGERLRTDDVATRLDALEERVRTWPGH